MLYNARISRIASSSLSSVFKPSLTNHLSFSSFSAAAAATQCHPSPPPSSPTSSLYTNILPLCSSTLSLLQTQQAHASALVHGLLPGSVSVCAALVLRYATFNYPNASRLLFSQSVHFTSTAFLWNTLIRAYTICFAFPDALGTYNRMVSSGVVLLDDHTFPFVIKVCSDCGDVWKGKEVHGMVFKLGFDSDLYVDNTLLLFYGGIGELKDAQKVFDEMTERDLVSWNTAIGVFSDNGFDTKALDTFWEMKFSSGFMPNAVSVVSVLPTCAGLEDECSVREIQSYAVKVGLDCQVIVGNALIDAYGKCGNVKASRQVFSEIFEKNEFSWNAMIASFAYTGCDRDALHSLRLMLDSGLKADSFSISSMLPVLVQLECFKLGKEVHGFSIRMNLDSDIFVANSLIDMYAKAGKPTEASCVFNNINARNVVSWNAMIANFALNKHQLEALGLVREMQAHGETPNSVTLTNVLPPCARLGSLCSGKEIHARAVRTGATSNIYVSNALTDMYAKCRCLYLAEKVFMISKRDEISYNILILSYSQTSDCLKSINLFVEMGLKHNAVSFVGVLSACANMPAMKQGKEIHAFAIKKLYHAHLFVANSLVDLYTKCGRIDLAMKVFDRIAKRDAASWNILILGFGLLGELDTAINLFEAMAEDGVEYDSISYLSVLSACSHGGLIEKGRKYFDVMCARNIKPTQMHYACMIDLLGRAGLMEEAVQLIQSMPVEADSNVWGALLGACRLHGDVELGCWAAEHLFELEPEHSGYYILLSNMYADAGRWDDADRIRELMKSRRVKKSPGYSWVQIRDKVQAFLVGERIEELKLCS